MAGVESNDAFINEVMKKAEKAAIESNGGKNWSQSKHHTAFLRVLLVCMINYKDEKTQELEGTIAKLQTEVTTQQTQITTLTTEGNAKDEIIKKQGKYITELQDEKIELQNQTDAGQQYNRRDNFKITGIPYVEGENLIDVVKSVTKHMGKEISEHDISDIHRLNNQSEANGATRVPNIICRVNRRRVKYEIMDNKKHLRAYPHPDYPNLGIYEDLTPLRSRILYALRNRKNENGSNTFKFTWSKEGRIFCRTEQQTKPGLGQKLPKPGIVNKPSDLMKLGFTEQEVKDIVCNKRI